MSDLTNTFTSIANAIRAKTSTTITYKPTEMANAINSISVGMTLKGPNANVVEQFNLPVTIPNNVTNMYNCFYNCINFNQPVTIPGSVTNMTNCFFACINFNQPITIPNGVTSLVQCFYGCYNLNQPVTLSSSVRLMDYCFAFCNNFNQPITIPNSVTEMVRCFGGCNNFNQPVTIPSSVRNIHQCFSRCLSFGSTVKIACNSSLNVSGMFSKCNNSKVKTIITNNVTPFLGNTASNSIVGAAITWTQSGTNYYNTVYNIYVNYSANPLA